jgi:hypothetical protein
LFLQVSFVHVPASEKRLFPTRLERNTMFNPQYLSVGIPFGMYDAQLSLASLPGGLNGNQLMFPQVGAPMV